MSVTYIKGDGSPRRIRSGGISIDRYGLATGSIVYWSYTYGALLNLSPVFIGSAHPDAPSLSCEKVTYNDSDGGATMEASYAGILGNILPLPVDELDTTVMEAPIEAHPNFTTTALAGSPDGSGRGSNGAVFTKDSNGNWRFDQFGPEAPAAFRGITSFEVPTSISRRTTITKLLPDASAVGTRRVPFNTFGITADWLLIGVSSQKRGAVYVTKYEWKASGRLGWNTAVYS